MGFWGTKNSPKVTQCAGVDQHARPVTLWVHSPLSYPEREVVILPIVQMTPLKLRDAKQLLQQWARVGARNVTPSLCSATALPVPRLLGPWVLPCETCALLTQLLQELLYTLYRWLWAHWVIPERTPLFPKTAHQPRCCESMLEKKTSLKKKHLFFK